MEQRRIVELTAALYRVTDRMDLQEPLKWQLRKCALRLSELYTKEADALSLSEEVEWRGLLRDMNRMLELASSLSYISRINFEVLLREYLPLEKSKIEIQGAEASEQNHSDENDEKKKSAMSVEEESILSRRKKLLEYLAEKTNSSVGELIVYFGSAISEKTLQRDLNTLMIQGLVRAEGDKRWRRYSLIGH